MSTDYRALCAELLDELSGYASANPHHDSDALVARARAALGEPVVAPARPTDEELDEPLGDLIDRWCQEGMQVKPHGTPFPLAHYVASKAYQYGLRKGRPAPAPAEGEVAELVAWLRDRAAGNERFGAPTASAQLIRAADLLEQRQAAPVPVAVSERLPGPEDCDAEGRCWVGYRCDADDVITWDLTSPAGLTWKGIQEMDGWLPATALPLPQGEVQP